MVMMSGEFILNDDFFFFNFKNQRSFDFEFCKMLELSLKINQINNYLIYSFF